MRYKSPIVFILCMAGFYGLHAAMPVGRQGNPDAVKQFINHKDWNFVENKGQLSSSEIKYYGHQGGVYLYCKPAMIEFVFTRAEKESDQISEATSQAVSDVGVQNLEPLHRKQQQPSKTITNRADLVLLSSNPHAQVIASDQQEYYENYYTANTPEEGITNVHTYKTITYKDIYPHIDMVLHAKEGSMKYEFVVYPGGKVSNIQMEWRGIEKIERFPSARAGKDSGIEYSCPLGNMTESAPFSFVRADPCVRPGELNPDKGRTCGSAPYKTACEEIQSQFIIKNNIVGFKTAEYDKTKLLVIDPTLVWGTYYYDVESNALAIDNSGNVYITGNSNADNISTSGAYQTSIAGGLDAFITKFNSAGIVQWATFYGGNADDEAEAITIDKYNNIFITGITQSSSGIATTGAHQTQLYIQDAFLTKFNSNGNLQWGTYYGYDGKIGVSSGQTFSNGVANDSSGNVYITGYTNSPSGIATTGAYATSYVYFTDPFLAKFNTNGQIQWGTYYGAGLGGANGITIDKSQNIYICGFTENDSGIATSGSYQSFHGGYSSSSRQDNAFLAKFTSDDSILWATYYSGSGDDSNNVFCIGNGVAVDDSENVYLIGYTASTLDIATKGAFQTSYGGGTDYGDAFLVKFNKNGSRKWGTYYGGIEDEIGVSVMTDSKYNVYIAGYTWSDSGIASNCAYQLSNAGYDDVFFAELNSSGRRLWGTYYGGDSPDILNCAALDDSGNIYITGQSNSSSGIATSGAYQTSLNGPSNAFLAKFTPQSPYDAGILSILTPLDSICPGKYAISVKLHNFGANELDSVTITLAINKIVQPEYYWFGKLTSDSSISVNFETSLFLSGPDSIKAWTSNPNGNTDCIPENDTAWKITKIIKVPPVNPGPPETICEDSATTVGAPAVNGYSYSWTSDPAGFSSAASKPYVNPVKTTTYNLTVTDNTTGCSNSDSVLITVNPAPPVDAGVNSTICAGNNTVIGDTASSAYRYNWISNPSGFSSTSSEPTVSPKNNTTYTLIVTNPKTGCSAFKSISVTVNPLPVPGIDSAHYTICTGSHIAIGINAVPDIAYSWTSQPTGFTSSLSNPIVNPAGNTIYFLTETNTQTGCSSNDSSKVTVTIPKAPVSSPGFNQTICYGNIAVLGADPIAGITYSWTSDPPGFTSTLPKAGVKPDTTTTYYLTVKNNIGCSDLGAVVVKVNPLPVVSAGLPQTVCSGTAVQLGSLPVGGDSYSWTSIPTGFQSNISNPVDSPNITTKYYVKASIDSTGCSNSDSVQITVVPRPNALFGVKNINGFEYQFMATSPNYPSWQYHWSFGDTASGQNDTASGYNVSHTYTVNGKYEITLTISLPGLCTEIDTYQVIINEQFSLNIFPNPFELQTDINYTLVNPGHVRISLVDELGQQLGTLLDKQLSQGEYNTYFDATLWRTRPAMYFILFQIDDKLIVKKVIQFDALN